MTSALHAEIHEDGQRVVLFGVGPAVPVIARSLEGLTPLLKPVDAAGGAIEAPLCWPLVVQLACGMPALYRPGPRLQAWTAAEVMRRMPIASETELSELTPPDGMALRPYQWEGARMLGSVGRGFLFDDQGTGKTITVIAAALLRRALGHVPVAGPIVVVCPSSVVDPWVDAWNEWTSLRAIPWRGENRRRRLGTADVYVAGYATARLDAVSPRRATKHAPKRSSGPLWDLDPSIVIADECHALKNKDAKQSQVVRRLGQRANSVFALSGTPITHTVADLWPNLEMLDPAGYPSSERYTSRYLQDAGGDYGANLGGMAPWTEKEFRQALLGQHRRVSKQDVLPQLPPKVYSVREVELPKEYRRAYDDLEREMLAQLPDEDVELSTMTELAKLELLCRLACAAADVAMVEVEVDDPLNPGCTRVEMRPRATLRAPSWKVDALLEVLEERPGKQTLVFAPSRQLVTVAAELVGKAGHRVGAIVGGQSQTERTRVRKAFQAGELDVCAVSTRAGGVGLTLTAASTVVFLQRPWAYWEAIQAEDRAHRIGSEVHDMVEIIDIVAKDTVDSRVRDVLKGKAASLSELLDDPRILEQVLGGRK